jgi:tRNA(adenine34) deaminase
MNSFTRLGTLRAPLRRSSCFLSTETATTAAEAFTKEDESFMKLALRHAQHAFRENEVPIGAVIVDGNGEVIAASRNKIESLQDASAHAEMDCLRKASSYLNNWRLLNCTLYSTLEPCPMCFSAIQSFRIKRVVYGAPDLRMGACGTYLSLHTERHPFHQVEVTGGLLAEESAGLLKRFFVNRRSDAKLSKKDAFIDRGFTDDATTGSTSSLPSV